MSRAACTCERYEIPAPDGSILEGELRRDPDCRQHGFPTTGWPLHNREGWPAGHPLRRHQIQTWRTVYLPARLANDGTVLIQEDERIELRWETPRETEARLYRESLRSAA